MNGFNVEVSTTFLVDGQSDSMEVTCPTHYEYDPKGRAVLRYDEYNDEGCIATVIEATPDRVDILRQGGMIDLHLTVGEKVSAQYASPYGVIMIDYTTEKIGFSLGEDGGLLELLYTMDIGGAPSRNHVLVKVIRCEAPQ